MPIYIPTSPASIDSVDGVRGWIEDELLSISQAESQRQDLMLNPLFKPPEKPRDGLIVYADGTLWNPGGGKGSYEYTNGSWNKLFTTPSAPFFTFIDATQAVSLPITSGVITNIISIAVPAGDWLVSGMGYFNPNAGTTIFKMTVSLTTASGTLNPTLGRFNEQGIPNGGFLTGDPAFTTLPIPAVRFILGSPSTVFLTGRITFSGSTAVVGGYINARRLD